MHSKSTKKWAPIAPEGVTPTVGAKARKRRERLRQQTEIERHAPAKRRNDLAPALDFVMAATASLKPASRQVRRRDAAQNARLLASIDRFGICQPVLITADRTIVAGHGVWEIAQQRGIEEIPCIVIDHLDASEVRLYRPQSHWRKGPMGRPSPPH
jgi:hypothetical protein